MFTSKIIKVGMLLMPCLATLVIGALGGCSTAIKSASSINNSTIVSETKEATYDISRDYSVVNYTDKVENIVSNDTESIIVDDISSINEALTDDINEEIQSPYKIATTIDDVRAILEINDGIIPVTNIEVSEIVNGSANGIIITEQDLEEALIVLNYIYSMPGGYPINNLVTASVGISGDSHKMDLDYEHCLDAYIDYGILFDKETSTWIYNNKPIGFFYDDGLVYVNLPFDWENDQLSTKIADSDRVLLNVAYKRVGLIDSIREITAEKAARNLKYFIEENYPIISNR